MKNKNLLILLLIFVVTIVGCRPTLGSKEVDNDDTSNSEPTIADYYPLMEDTIFNYEGIGNEFAERKVYFEFIDDHRVQLKSINPATSVVRVLEYGEGQLKEIYYEGEFYHIENMLNVKEEQNNILLMEPLVLGNQWTTPDGHNRSITGVNVDMETPMDTFKALEVTTDLGEGKTQKHYYVKDIGLVASIYEDGTNRVETLLQSMEEGPLEVDIEVYYPLYSDMATVYIRDKINFNTNQSIKKLLGDVMQTSPNEKLIPAIPTGSVINEIKLDRTSWTLLVDFSHELLTNMNAGSSLETEILKSMVNTLGKFYDVEKVYISVEGKPYESGHYALRDDEFFSVDTEGIQEYR